MARRPGVRPLELGSPQIEYRRDREPAKPILPAGNRQTVFPGPRNWQLACELSAAKHGGHRDAYYYAVLVALRCLPPGVYDLPAS
jgi:hypothetical protein